ncbi:hypothetical protein NUU61_001285 [Penicillium alfredii]|uniref:Uncharacterized protein n=1 Tax=Penicillium alfredii TaxID=1506179 RepID=A0A9W9GB72_9EURO|nr:uncharacterized protein NUU61_001285 [Penicillium alfredii]KAJ5115526.1 hypothetical protein NUU61_001285 [Penicillium alfredii]
MSEIEAIVQATHVLSGLSVINIQDLLPYQNKLENTLRILERSLEAIQRRSSQLSGSVKPSLRPYSPTSSPDPQPPFQHGSDEPSPRPSSSSQPSTPRADERNSLVSDESENLGSDARSLLQALGDSKRSKKILDYLSSGSDPINGSQNDWIQEDPRVNDIKFCSTNRSLDAKFRRGLGQRSLAIEYDEWEQKIFNTSRVSELCRDLSAADQHDGHINQFLRENTHRFKDEKSASHGIRHGIRLLVFERTYEHVGVSAILILVYSQFRSVKYKNYLLLKELLQKDHLWGSLASGKSSWFRQCEKQYEDL